MRSVVTFSLPKDLKDELDRLAKEEGVSRSGIVGESLRDYLFSRRPRHIRQRLQPLAARGGIFTDEDAFKRLS